MDKAMNKYEKAIKTVKSLSVKSGINDIKVMIDIDLAIQALERQIPKKPYLDESAERTLFKCSNCKRIRVTKWEDSLRSGIETEFCPHCGQRFDWD